MHKHDDWPLAVKVKMIAKRKANTSICHWTKMRQKTNRQTDRQTDRDAATKMETDK